MTKAQKRASKPKKSATAKTVTSIADKENFKVLMANAALRPSVNAAAVMSEYAKPFGEQDVNALADALLKSIAEVHGGDLYRCEAMLVAQAHALQSIFMNFSRRALSQDYLQHLESFLRLAMKAQNQCRMTLETLATIKNPPIVYARQANVTTGPQQINNGTAAPSRAREIENLQNKLLGAQDVASQVGTSRQVAKLET